MDGYVECFDVKYILRNNKRNQNLCQHDDSDFSIDHRGFDNLTEEEKNQFLDYKLMIYICEGTDKEKLDWFKIINIAGVQLTDQELRNAIYTGPWLSEAKRYYSKNGCPAYQIAEEYMKGSTIRQDYLETALKWISARDGIAIEDYMAAHQHDTSCNELWLYFQSVINWVKVLFPNYRKEMKGLDWGIYYNQHKDKNHDPATMEKQIVKLMEDDDVTKKSGIYEYLLDGKEKHLSIRTFTMSMKRAAYERQKGICPICGKHFAIDEMQADHITPWSKGGRTTADNCQMLCAEDNRRKSDI